MATVTIDGQEIEFEKGESIIEVATRKDIEIPYYCWHPRLSVAANCRMCLVEVEKAPKLLPACQTECRDEMVVNTANARVKDAQRAVHEFLLINHPIDCPICDQAGECKLQDYFMEYQHVPSRMHEHKVGKPRLEKFGPNVMYNGERCIMCTRCVRFMDEIAKQRQLGVFNRGDHAEIGIFPGEELDSPYSLNTVDVCPVGALTSRAFRFKQRAWNLKRSDSICGGCAKGCNMHVDQRSGVVYRFLPRENDAVNAAWMCDAGRLTVDDVNDERIPYAFVKEDDQLWATPKSDALAKAVELLKPVAGSGCGVAMSLHTTCEQAYVLGRFAKEVLKVDAVALLENAPWEGDDILRVADRNPNRRGIEMVLKDLGLEAIDQATLEQRISSARVKALLVLGHECEEPGKLASMAKNLEVLVHIAHRRTEIAEAAHVTLPSLPHVQIDGTWVNVDGRAQRLVPGFETEGDAQDALSWILQLADGLGVSFALPSVQNVRLEMERSLGSVGEGVLTDVGAEGRSMEAGAQ